MSCLECEQSWNSGVWIFYINVTNSNTNNHWTLQNIDSFCNCCTNGKSL